MTYFLAILNSLIYPPIRHETLKEKKKADRVFFFAESSRCYTASKW